ncbi:hypothetical protein XMV208_003402 [Aliiroseovarius sp. xm-v-208]|nr:hypothetical protein [Aliiroseovarius sp. xm-v-208]
MRNVSLVVIGLVLFFTGCSDKSANSSGDNIIVQRSDFSPINPAFWGIPPQP